MVNTREKAVNELNKAIETTKKYTEAVRTVISEHEDAHDKDVEEETDLQEQINNLKAKQDDVVERAEAKELVKQITDLENELELTKEINQRLNNQRTNKVADAVVNLLDATKSGKQAFSNAEKTIGMHTSLSTFKADVEYMKESAHKLNTADSFGKSVLLDFKIIDNSVPNYAGHYLNGAGTHTRLEELFDAGVLRDHKIFIGY